MSFYLSNFEKFPILLFSLLVTSFIRQSTAKRLPPHSGSKWRLCMRLSWPLYRTALQRRISNTKHTDTQARRLRKQAPAICAGVSSFTASLFNCYWKRLQSAIYLQSLEVSRLRRQCGRHADPDICCSHQVCGIAPSYLDIPNLLSLTLSHPKIRSE